MLTELRIRNLAIIEDLALSFGAGLNLLTGETGAGKSIIVDALSLVTGGRADAQMVRSGERTAVVEATFEGLSAAASVLAAEIGAEVEDGAMLLRRETTADGKSRAFVGGRAVPVASLREIGELLVDLHGQHQSRTLLKAGTHLAALDRYGDLEELRSETAAACESVRRAARALSEAAGELKGRGERLEMLRFQEGEIAAAEPRPGEEAALRAERARLSHADRIASLTARMHGLLSEDEGSALERIGAAQALLQELARLDPEAAAMEARLAEARYAMEDLAVWASERRSQEADPRRLEAVESRLALLASLARKHGVDPDLLPERRDRLREQAARLEAVEESLEALRRGLAEVEATYAAVALRLSLARRKAAGRLARDLEAELSGLAFETVRVEVAIGRRVESASSVLFEGEPVALSPEGLDLAELLFSSNPGEELRPLARIASGGELSRVMLSLNVLLGGRRKAPGGWPGTIVFDEVDAGIGGRTADAVGDRLSRLAAARQVLCVTHLPQIACRARSHWRVSKGENNGRTLVIAEPLDQNGRIEELAQMLGGRSVTEAAIRHAREMLRCAPAAGAKDRERGGSVRRPAGRRSA